MPRSFRQLYKEPLPENPCWIGGGVLPKGGILLLGGLAKIGKTFVQLDMADKLALGERWWDGYEVKEKARVLYVDNEIGSYELQRRICVRHDKLSREPQEGVFYLSKEPGMFLDTQTGIEFISNEIESCGANVLIVDPVSYCMVGNENDNSDVQKLVRHLKELMVKHADKDLSIVLSHHFGKPPRVTDDEHDPLSPYNFRGASKWFDMADSLITFQRVQSNGARGEWWRLNCRFELRQAPKPPDVTMIVGDGGLLERANKMPLPPKEGTAERLKGLPKAKGGWR